MRDGDLVRACTVQIVNDRRVQEHLGVVLEPPLLRSTLASFEVHDQKATRLWMFEDEVDRPESCVVVAVEVVTECQLGADDLAACVHELTEPAAEVGHSGLRQFQLVAHVAVLVTDAHGDLLDRFDVGRVGVDGLLEGLVDPRAEVQRFLVKSPLRHAVRVLEGPAGWAVLELLTAGGAEALDIHGIVAHAVSPFWLISGTFAVSGEADSRRA